MGAPTVYRWDDDQAPVARGESTSLIEILTACLVDGYGSKQAAGWTKEFENVNGDIAAFRNDSVSGTGMFLQVDGTQGNINYVNGFETMSDENTGTEPFVDPLYDAIITTSNAAGTTPRPWVMIADARIFYLFIWHGAQTSDSPADIGDTVEPFGKPLVFGDIISLYDNDPFACILCASYTTSTSYGSGFLTLREQQTSISYSWSMYLARKINGEQKATYTHLCLNGGPVVSSEHAMGHENYCMVPRTANYDLYARPFLIDHDPNTIRGYLPGLYYPCHGRSNYTNLATETIGGVNLLPIHALGQSNIARCCALFDISENFRP